MTEQTTPSGPTPAAVSPNPVVATVQQRLREFVGRTRPGGEADTLLFAADLLAEVRATAQPPTREQIALTLARCDGIDYTTAEVLPEWRLNQADAVLALFPQPGASTEQTRWAEQQRQWSEAAMRSPQAAEPATTPSYEADDLQWCHLCGAVLDGTADDRRVHRHAFEGLRPPEDDEQPAEPVSIADMAPGTVELPSEVAQGFWSMKALRAAHTEFESTRDLHELARAVGNILKATGGAHG